MKIPDLIEKLQKLDDQHEIGVNYYGECECCSNPFGKIKLSEKIKIGWSKRNKMYIIESPF